MLRAEADSDAWDQRHLREEAVIVSRPLAEAMPLQVKGESGDQNEVEVARLHRGVVARVGFWDAKVPIRKGVGIGDVIELHRLLARHQRVVELHVGQQRMQEREVGLMRHRGIAPNSEGEGIFGFNDIDEFLQQ